MAAKRTNANLGDTLSSAVESVLSDTLTSALSKKLKGSALESILTPPGLRSSAKNGMDEATKRFAHSVDTFDGIVKSASKSNAKTSGPTTANGSPAGTEKETSKQIEQLEKLSSTFQDAKTSALDLKVQVEKTSGTDGRGGIGQLLSQMEMWKESTDDLKKASDVLSKTQELLGKTSGKTFKEMAANAAKSSAQTIASNTAATASSGAMGVAGATGTSMMFPPPLNFVLLGAGIAAVIGALAMAAKVATSGGAKGISAPTAPSLPSLSIPSSGDKEKASEAVAEKTPEPTKTDDDKKELEETIQNAIRASRSSDDSTKTDVAPQISIAESAKTEPLDAGDYRNDPIHTEEMVEVLKEIKDNTKKHTEPEIRARAIDIDGNVIPTRRDAEQSSEQQKKDQAPSQESETFKKIAKEESEQTKLLRTISAQLDSQKTPAYATPKKPETQPAPTAEPPSQPSEKAPSAGKPAAEKTGVAKLVENVVKLPILKEATEAFKNSPVVKAASAAKQIFSGVFQQKNGASDQPTNDPAKQNAISPKPQAESQPSEKAPSAGKPAAEKTGVAKLVENVVKLPILKEATEAFKNSPVVKAASAAKQIFSGVFKAPGKDGDTKKQSGQPSAQEDKKAEFSPNAEIAARTKLEKFRELFFRKNRERQKIEREESLKDDEQRKLSTTERLREGNLRIAQYAKEEVARAKSFAKEKAQHVQKLAMGKARMFSDKLELLTKLKNNAMKMASDAVAFAKEKATAMMTIAIRGAKAAASMVQKAMMWPFPVNAIAIASGAALIAGGVLLAKKLLSGDSGGGAPAAEGGEAPKEGEGEKGQQGGGGTSVEDAKQLAREETKSRKSDAKSKLSDTFWKLSIATIVMLLKKIADGKTGSDSKEQSQKNDAGSSFGNGNVLNPHTPGEGKGGGRATQTDVADSFAPVRYASNMTRNS